MRYGILQIVSEREDDPRYEVKEELLVGEGRGDKAHPNLGRDRGHYRYTKPRLVCLVV